jgi:hypothetical protein
MSWCRVCGRYHLFGACRPGPARNLGGIRPPDPDHQPSLGSVPPCQRRNTGVGRCSCGVRHKVQRTSGTPVSLRPHPRKNNRTGDDSQP